MCQIFEWHNVPQSVRTFSDADWAGCKLTRRSTIGGCIMVGRHTIKSWSRTQSLVVLSSGESELYATLKAAAESLGMISLLKYFGWHVAGEIWGDASATLGIQTHDDDGFRDNVWKGQRSTQTQCITKW